MENAANDSRGLCKLFCQRMAVAGKILEPCKVDRIESRLESNIIYLHAGSQRFVIKAFKQTSGSNTALQAATEYVALQQLFDIDAKDRLVPQPYPMLTDAGAVAMEFVDGPTLTDYLLELSVPAAQKRALVEQAGRWLSKVHTHFRTSEDVMAFDDILNALDLAAFRAGNLSLIHRAVKLLEAGSAILKDVPLSMTRLHGDFKTGNLIVAGDRVIGIDTTLRHTSSGLRDAAPFLNDMDLVFHHPRGLWTGRHREALLQSFLRGLDATAKSGQLLALNWFQLAALLGWWARLLRQDDRSLKSRYLDAVHARLTRMACSTLEVRLST